MAKRKHQPLPSFDVYVAEYQARIEGEYEWTPEDTRLLRQDYERETKRRLPKSSKPDRLSAWEVICGQT